MTFISIMNVPLDAAHTYFSFYLKDTAKDWYFQLAPAVQNSLSKLKSAFLAPFKPQVPFSLGLVDITQQNTESVDQYISRIRKLSTDSTIPEDCLPTMIMKGLKPAIVMPQCTQTIDDLRTKSAAAKMTVLMNKQSLSSETSDNSVVNAMSVVCDVTNQLQQTITAVRTTFPNNVPYHEDTADHPAQGYSRRDSRQANRYRGPHSSHILHSGSRDPSSHSPINNKCAEPRHVHNNHQDSAATVEVSLASLNLIVLPEVIFVENVEIIIISKIAALIHFLITVVIHIRDSCVFLE